MNVFKLERDMIVERAQEGKVIAKQREDFREELPNKLSKKQVEHAFKAYRSPKYRSGY